MKKILIITAMTITASGIFLKASAQEYFSAQYVMAFPVNDLSDYISETSFRGIGFEYQTKVNTNIAAGISLGWNTFYERKPYATYRDGNASLSGIQYRYSNAVPAHITGQYFLNEKKFAPFVGFGIGANFTRRTTDMGLYRWEEEAWSFSLRPEVGFMFHLRETTALKVALRYNEVFQTSELDDQSFFSLGLGLVFMK
jgi:Outer membrane protein beta-barrel domain